MAEARHVLYSTVLDAPLDKCWNILRPFDQVPGLPPASTIHITNDKDNTTVGAVRRINIGPGFVIETLLSFSDEETTFSYSIDQHSENMFPASPAGLKNYVAKLALHPITDGDRTFARWEADWVGDDAEGTRQQLKGIFSGVLRKVVDAVQP